MPRDCEDEPTGHALGRRRRSGDRAHVRAEGRALPRARRRGRGALATRSSRGWSRTCGPGLAGALRVPGDRVVYPVNAARWLLSRGPWRRGAVRREGVEARRDRSAARARRGRGRFEAGAVVNAAGAAAPLLTPGLPVAPRKGHLVITDRYPGLLPAPARRARVSASAHTPSPESVAFNLQPRATGQMLLGSSREFVGLRRRDQPADPRAHDPARPSSSCRRSRASRRSGPGSGFAPRRPTTFRSSAAGPRTPGPLRSPRVTRASASRRRSATGAPRRRRDPRPRERRSTRRRTRRCGFRRRRCLSASRCRGRTAHRGEPASRWPRRSRERGPVDACGAPSPASRAASSARWGSASSAASRSTASPIAGRAWRRCARG